MKKTISLLIFIGCTFLVKAQPPKKFFSTYGGNGYDVGYDVKQTLDNGYIITGSTSSFGQGNTDMYLLKLDSMGVKKFETSFGGVSNEVGKSVVQLTDSSYVIAGYTSSTGVGGYDIFLVKTDKTGTLLWQKTIGGTDWDFAYSLQATLDGGFIIAGTTYSYGRGNADGYIVKTDANGIVSWQKTYGGLNNDEFKSVIQTADGNYALTGYTKSYNDVDSGDVWVFKVDAVGDSSWCKFYGGSKEDFGNEIIEHPNSNLFVAGGTESFNFSKMNGYLIQMDNSGNYINQQFDNTSTSFAYFTSVVIASRSTNIITVIAKETFATFGLQFKILELNSSLGYLNGTDYGSSSDDETFKAIATKDKGYAFIGYTKGYNSILSDVYIVKIDSNLIGGNYSIVSVKENSFNSFFTRLYPNPAQKEILVNYNFLIDVEKIRMTDITGKEISLDGKVYSISDNKLKINIEEIENGIYIFQYNNYSEKILIMR